MKWSQSSGMILAVSSVGTLVLPAEARKIELYSQYQERVLAVCSFRFKILVSQLLNNNSLVVWTYLRQSRSMSNCLTNFTRTLPNRGDNDTGVGWHWVGRLQWTSNAAELLFPAQ